jgi:polar amino acid transport system substrate-binding protein
MKKSWSLGPIIFTMFLFIFACVISSHADDSVARVKKAGELVIASTVTGVPTTFMDTKTNEVQGTMIDAAKYVADKLGVKLKVVETPWSALIPSLTGKKVDLICAAMVITEKRKEVLISRTLSFLIVRQ